MLGAAVCVFLERVDAMKTDSVQLCAQRQQVNQGMY